MKLKKGETILFIGDSITDCNRGRHENIKMRTQQLKRKHIQK